MSNHHHPDETRHRRPSNVITRAFAGYDEPRLQSPRGNACIAFFRFKAVASGGTVRAEEQLHLDLCNSCRRILAGIRAELGGRTSPVDEDMCWRNAMRNVSMPMPEGGTGCDATIASVCADLRKAISIRPFPNADPQWSLEGGLSVLKDLRLSTFDWRNDSPSRRRDADDYATTVATAPPAIKVALVYGLISLKDARRFAVDVVRAIARRNDPVAHQVMVFTLTTEGRSIMAVESEQWSRVVAEVEPVLLSYRDRSETSIARFMETVKPPHTLHQAKVTLRRMLIDLLDRTFASREPAETMLHLLAVRHFLDAVVEYTRDTYSDIGAYLPKLIPLVLRRARKHLAPQALALEVCEKLQPSDPFSIYIKQMQFQWSRGPLPQAERKEVVAE